MQRYHAVSMKHDHFLHFIWHEKLDWKMLSPLMIHQEEAVSHLSFVVWNRRVVVAHGCGGF